MSLASSPIVGIDVGFKGGIAVIRPWLAGTNLEAEVFKMPVRKSPKGKGTEYDISAVSDLIPEKSRVFIEKQQPFPSQGSVSAGKLMEGQGLMLGICAARKLSHTLVSPKVWQRSVFCGKPHKDTKAASISECTKLYPHVSLTPGRSKVPQDGLSDALLIATYGLRLSGGDCSASVLKGVRWGMAGDETTTEA